ncbi:hypothetical protein SODG_005420 [Sodalis praecaptivus]
MCKYRSESPYSPPLDEALCRASVACSLSGVVVEKAGEEGVSPALFDLISLTRDLNFEVRRSLNAVMEDS